MPCEIVIVSAGKLGRVIYNWVADAIAAGQPWKLKGFLDDRKDRMEKFNYDIPVLGSVEEYAPADNDRFICAIGEPQPKRIYCEKILAKGGRFVNLIHPTVVMGRNVVLGTGVILGPYCVVDPDLSIGNFVCVLAHSICSHDSVIGDWCQICSHVVLGGNVTIEEMVFIGSNACLVPSARLGAGSYVGACSLVLRRVAPRTKVFGVPAMPIENLD